MMTMLVILNEFYEQHKRITDYEKQFTEGAPVICHTARKVIYPHGEIRVEQTMGQTEEKPAPSGPAVARRILLGEPLEDGYGSCPTCSQMARLSTYKLIRWIRSILSASGRYRFHYTPRSSWWPFCWYSKAAGHSDHDQDL